MIFPNAPFPVVATIFFYLFVLSCVVELVFAFLEKEKWRVLVKPTSMFFLGLMAIFATFKVDYILLYVAIFCGMIGDILLALKHHGDMPFVIGAVFFLAGHICYITRMMLFIPSGNLSWIWVLILCPIFYCALLYPCKRMVGKWALAIPGTFYLSTLLSDIVAGVVLLANGHISAIMVIIGGLSFFASDIYLSKTQFVKHDKREDFYIMATYLLGQVLIVMGILFI